jgi:hypothetical protein
MPRRTGIRDLLEWSGDVKVRGFLPFVALVSYRLFFGLCRGSHNRCAIDVS